MRGKSVYGRPPADSEHDGRPAIDRDVLLELLWKYHPEKASDEMKAERMMELALREQGSYGR